MHRGESADGGEGVILWKHVESGETCRVVYCDYDPALKLTAVQVAYFGDGETEFEWLSVEDFFGTHVPERIHS